MNFATLYKIGAQSKIQEWRIHVSPEAVIRVEHGERGGKMVVHEKQLTEGKGKRTPLEQAIQEAQRKWTNKKEKELYAAEEVPSICFSAAIVVAPSSASNHKRPRQEEEEVVVEVVEEEVNGTENEKSKETKKEQSEEKETIKKSILVRPMLAQTFDKTLYTTTTVGTKKRTAYKLPLENASVQRKYDGIRCLAHWSPAQQKVILESRKGIVFHNFGIIEEQVLALLKHNYSTTWQDGCVYLDGELYTDKVNFEVISGLVRQKTVKDAADQDKINQLQLCVYDLFDVTCPQKTFAERWTTLSNMFFMTTAWTHLQLVETVPLPQSQSESSGVQPPVEAVQRMHDQFFAEGFEGIMIRANDGIYEPNRRSKYLQKYKMFMEDEFTITGFHEGTGDEKGAIIWECVTNDDQHNAFSVRPKGTFASRKELYLRGGDFIHKKLTVIFQEYDAYGIPRFPVGKAIREDGI